jgi:hypothetical protein
MRLYQLLAVFLFLFTAQAAEETAIVAEGKINVRGQPSLIGEVVTQLEQGDKVTVLERITNSTPRTPGEPTNWARIKLPPNTPVWVFAPFVKDGTVAVSRLNVRGGRGENYSVLGRMTRGESVKVIRSVEEWMEIEPPTNSYAFVDLSLLHFGMEAPAVAATAPQTSAPQSLPTSIAPQPQAPLTQTQQTSAITNAAPEPVIANTRPEVSTNVTANAAEPVPAASANAQASVTITNEAPSVTIAPAQSNNEAPPVSAPAVAARVETPATNNPASLPATTAPEVAAAAPTVPQALPQVAPEIPKKSGPLQKRVVRREGIVRPTTSIQAPTWYELVHAETKKRINYLFDENMGINLKDYRGQRVVVSGEEAIDPRWPNTPILDMQTLDVLPDEGR